MENERNYFFRDLVVKILLVLLFIFLLMWLFPMPNLNPFYDRIFTQNINTMTDAAKSYFTVSRLPQAEGESKKLTLSDMIDNKMLVEFTDSEGKTCDKDNSYVEVTKRSNEYVFKTNLSCSTGEDYVIEYFGCYNVCNNGKCTSVIDNSNGDIANNNNKNNNSDNNNNNKNNNNMYDPSEDIGSAKGSVITKKVTEYQFYRTDKTQYVEKYVCTNGYALNGTKCIKEGTITKEEDASLKCNNGYTYNKNTKKCEKEELDEIAATLSCPEGYVYASSTQECIKSGNFKEVDAKMEYTCTTGTPVGSKCVYADLSITDAEKVYTCEKGTLNGTKCIVSYSDEDAEKVYTCESGVLDKDKCVTVSPNNKDAEVYYTCEEGTLEGTKCVLSTTTVDAKVSYSCSSGTLSGTSCIVSVPQTCGSYPVCSNKTYTVSMPTSSTGSSTRGFLYQIGETRVYQECHTVYSCSGGGTTTTSATATYSCAQGERSGSSCIIKDTVDAKKNYRCSTGILNGTKCYDNIISTTDAKLTYKCEHGTLNGTKCTGIGSYTINAKLSFKCANGAVDSNTGKCISGVTKETEAKKVYSCEVGTLEGTKCNISEVNKATPVYTCKYGTQKANDSKTCVVTTTDEKNPIYYCNSGYTLAGTKCYITQNTTDIVNATPIYKTKTDTVYKWSTKETLAGWTRTGKTRITEIVITSRD